MKTTIKDIAAYANVSISTVSLALNNNEKVKKPTRERIKKLAKQLNYVPSAQARALKLQKSRLVGYLLSSTDKSFFSMVLQGINQVSVANQYGVIVSCFEESTENSSEVIREQLSLFRNNGIDGLIVSGWTEETAGLIQEFENAKIPVIATSYITPAENIPHICVNNYHGMALATRHLIELGHTHLAYCSFDEFLIEQRYLGAIDVINRNKGVEIQKFSTCSDLLEQLSSANGPTGIIAAHDYIAIDIMRAVKQLNLSIPEDISIIGFDDIGLASLPEFNLTTIAQPKKLIGQQAMELLLKRINGEKVQNVLLEPELKVRGTTAKSS